MPGRWRMKEVYNFFYIYLKTHTHIHTHTHTHTHSQRSAYVFLHILYIRSTLPVKILLYFDNVRHYAATPNAFDEVVKMANHTECRETQLTRWSPSAPRQILLNSLDHNLGNNTIFLRIGIYIDNYFICALNYGLTKIFELKCRSHCKSRMRA